MAMGRRRARQQQLWVDSSAIARSPGHPFYRRLNEILDGSGFDTYVEGCCAPFYAAVMGRPSLAPAVYFRLLLIGYFEGIDSERGIAWRLADSLSLREYVGLRLSDKTPNHSTISRTRRLLDVETHQQVFTWILNLLAENGLLPGKTIGIDSTTLEANAALRSIVQRESGASYTEFLEGLARESGIETPTRADLAKIDKKRAKKGSNADWEHPHDPDARITKMKDGRTHLAHKAEHAVDMETGAILAVTVQDAVSGDTRTVASTEQEAQGNLAEVLENPQAAGKISQSAFAEVVADKGYHSNAVLTEHRSLGIRTYISEPDRGRRNWIGKEEEKAATYANRRRIRGRRGQALLRLRGELLERSFAHCYETGGMRRLHLRGRENILKRVLLQVAGFNLGLVMRKLHSFGKPKALQGLRALFLVLLRLYTAFSRRWALL